jgi:hypothetical protein
MVVFEDIQTGRGFVTNIEENDHFYEYLLPYIRDGKVEGETRVPIATLKIPKNQYPNIENTTYKMLASAIFIKGGNGYDGSVEIKRISVEKTKDTTIDYNNGYCFLKNCNMVLLYKTEITGLCDFGK